MYIKLSIVTSDDDNDPFEFWIDADVTITSLSSGDEDIQVAHWYIMFCSHFTYMDMFR